MLKTLNETISVPTIKNGTGLMSLLKQRDLLLLIKGGAKIQTVTLVPVKHKEKKYYEVHLAVQTVEGVEDCLLITYKNEPQRWSSLNKANDTLSELIPGLKEIVVKISKDI